MLNNSTGQLLLPIGTLLQMGKYRVDRYLSSGGFGNTYVITNLQFDEQFAMKEFFMKGINDREDDSTTVSVSNKSNHPQFEQQREKFKKEARRLRKLNNPHIVHVHDLFDENGTSYYVMDLIEGQSISSILKQTKKAIPENLAFDILHQVLDALQVVHEEGIWHLDLKPGNIMLDKKGTVVVIDFGASKQLSTSEGYTSTSSAMCYTPGYAPSEQIDQNMERIGPWTDFYALGATLYNIITLNQPPSVSEIMDGDAFEFPKTVSIIAKDLILWMMQPSRQKRPQSVIEIKRYIVRSDGKINNVRHDKDSILDKEDNSEETVYNDKKAKTNESPRIKKGNNELIRERTTKSTINHLTGKRYRDIIIIFSIAAIIVAIVIACFYTTNSSTEQNNYDYTETTLSPPKAATELDIDERIKSLCELNQKAFTLFNTVRFHSGANAVAQKRYDSTLGLCEYTGPLDENVTPNGIGIADFTDGRLYIGPFFHGRIQGDAFFRYDNGDTFEGSFNSKSEFSKGIYTISKDGSYFDGTFRNGKPYKGQWYNKDGNKI